MSEAKADAENHGSAAARPQNPLVCLSCYDGAKADLLRHSTALFLFVCLFIYLIRTQYLLITLEGRGAQNT